MATYREPMTHSTPALPRHAPSTGPSPSGHPGVLTSPEIPDDPALDELTADQIRDLERDLVDHLAAAERAKNALAAQQIASTAQLNRLRTRRDKLANIPKQRRAGGLGAEIGLARRESPSKGNARLREALLLAHHARHAHTALSQGHLNEDQVTVLARELAGTQHQTQHEVDAQLKDRYRFLGISQLKDEARGHVQRLEPQSSRDKSDRAQASRKVARSDRSDGMVEISGLVEAKYGVPVLDILRQQAEKILRAERAAYTASLRAVEDFTDNADVVDNAELGDDAERSENPQHDTAASMPTPPRTIDQIMADLFIAKLTHDPANDPDPEPASDAQSPVFRAPRAIELNLVMTDATLFAGDDTPAQFVGYGPIPAALAREWVQDEQIEVFLRRLYTSPETNQLVTMDSRSRAFPKTLRKMLVLRDHRCRNLYCDNPIDHADHIRRYRGGGQTSLDNGQGLCAVCNQMKETHGWTQRPVKGGLKVITPTGHSYFTQDPPLIPGMRRAA